MLKLLTRTILPLLLCSFIWTSIIADPGKIVELEKRLAKATDTTRINILNELSGLYASSDLIHADSLAREALNLLDHMSYPEGKIINFNHLTYIKGSLGKYDIGLDFSKRQFT